MNRPTHSRKPLRGFLLVVHIFNYATLIGAFIFVLQCLFDTNPAHYATLREFEARTSMAWIYAGYVLVFASFVWLMHARKRYLPKLMLGVSPLLFAADIYSAELGRYMALWIYILVAIALYGLILIYMLRSRRVKQTLTQS